MGHIALYREWRPQRFADIVGQEHLTRTLQNALRTQRFAHAYLFNGPRGTGKTSAAKILARAINCIHGPAAEPCNECAVCLSILDGSNMDVREIDAASNRGVDEIRDIRDKIKVVPTEARYKVYIIDEVHMLTTEAFNALLKTLEEPPEHVMFILATTEPHKLPATVISRCQRFDFRRIMTRDIADRLKSIAQRQGASVEEEAYWIVARSAEGGMRDALSLFDQVLSLGAMEVKTSDVEELIGATSLQMLGEISLAIANQDQREALTLLSKLLDLGKDPNQLLQEWTSYFRDLLLWKTAPKLAEMQDRLQYDANFADIAAKFPTGRLVQLLDLCGQTLTELKWQGQGRLLLELLIVRLCRAQDQSDAGLQERVQALEQELSRLRSDLRAVADNPPASSSPSFTTEPPQSINNSAPSATPVLLHTAPKSARSSAAPAAQSVGTSPPNGGARLREQSSQLSAGMGQLDTQFAAWQEESNQARLKAASEQWARILDRVKQIKIQTQAWLMNGEPVAAVPGFILVAFKNQIHQETCLKDIHKEIIESVFTEVLGESCKLTGILVSKWEKLREIISTPKLTEAHTIEKEARDAEQPVEEDALLREIKSVFGPDIVEVID